MTVRRGGQRLNRQAARARSIHLQSRSRRLFITSFDDSKQSQFLGRYATILVVCGLVQPMPL